MCCTAGRTALRLCWVLLALVLCPTMASAQVVTVRTDRPVAFTFNHDGAGTVVFPILLDGVEVKLIPVSAITNGAVIDSIPPVSRGNHTLVACARNADNRQACHAEVQFRAEDPAPLPPANFTITGDLLVVMRRPDGTEERLVLRIGAEARPVPGDAGR